MNGVPSPFSRSRLDGIAVLAKWVLGGLFIFLGVSKLAYAADYLKFVNEQLLVTDPTLAHLIVGVAPWLEFAYGLWLLSGQAQEAAALVARWWLGCVFIFMGLHKAWPHPNYFLGLVRQYDLVSTPWLLNSIGAALPWFEVFCGVLLLTGVAVRGAAINIILMLLVFTPVVLKRALAIMAKTHDPFCAIKFDCGCGAGEVYICHKLVENTVLLLLSLWLLTGCAARFSLRFNLLREKAHIPA